MDKTRGNLAFSQSKSNLLNEINFELSDKDLEEAVALSGYTKKEKRIFKNCLDESEISNTERWWATALSGKWKTMMDKDGWKLPATQNAYNICGKGFFKNCKKTDLLNHDVHNFARKFVYHCGRLGCEICAKRAGARLAKKIERRIWLFRLYLQKVSKDRLNPFPSHIIESIDSKDDFWKLPKQKQTILLKKIRKFAGISAGAEINHLWRFDKSNLTPFYSPHKHLIAFGWLKSNATQEIYDKFNVKVIYEKVKDGTLKTRLDVFSVAYYQLSHSAIKENKHSVKWFGGLSYRKISNKILEKFKDLEYITQDLELEKTKCCDICGDKLNPCKINPKETDWRKFIPTHEELRKGCRVKFGLFESVDFNKEEKIPYYDDNYQVFYKLTKQEQEQLMKLEKPEIYNRNSNGMDLTLFV